MREGTIILLMTNEQLAGLLELAAQRLRRQPASGVTPTHSGNRVTAEEYAKLKGLNLDSVRRICRRGRDIVARKEHKSWMIDVERTETLLTFKAGNAIEKSFAGVRGGKKR